MPVRGKNASGLINQKVGTELAGNSTDIAPLITACRTSIFIGELGAVITKGGGGTNATTAGKVHPSIWYQSPGAAAAILASKSGDNDATASEYTLGTVVGSEFTTRDATFKFAPSFVNAASRVFPKGTKFWGQNTSTSGASGTNDGFVVYIQVEEFGAPPA